MSVRFINVTQSFPDNHFTTSLYIPAETKATHFLANLSDSCFSLHFNIDALYGIIWTK